MDINLDNKRLGTLFLMKAQFLGEKFPLIKFIFLVEASNENIEVFLIETSRKEDSKRLVDDFHNSKGYNKEGKSKFLYSEMLTFLSITYEYVNRLFGGKLKNLPKDYTICNFKTEKTSRIEDEDEKIEFIKI